MEWSSADIEHKRFHVRWRGLDPREVQVYVEQATEEIQLLKGENASLRKDLQAQEKELKEFRDREKAIRTVLLNAHRTVENMKANAEKESRLIVSEAEIKAEKILQGAHNQLGRLHEEILGLKRLRIQLETKLKGIIEGYRELLYMDPHDESEEGPSVPAGEDKVNRSENTRKESMR